jgi:predicted secreted hydrolase
MNGLATKIVIRGFFLFLALSLFGNSALAAPASLSKWKSAIGERSWVFPRDHGAHPDYRTEWWYFTGNLLDEAGRRYGYQLTFFRQAMQPLLKDQHNSWLVRDIYLAHFAIADIDGKSFWFSDYASRTGPNLAGAKTNAMDVWCLNWSARMEKNRILLTARRGGVNLELELFPRKPPVFHGKGGLSKKGPLAGQSSWYYSFTDLGTRGAITPQGAKKAVKVSGISWFDQEFGSNQLTADQIGWDWFALHLSDGRDLMIYMMRKKDGSKEPSSSGTLVEKDGRARHLGLADIRLDILDYWKSPRSKGRYPAKWRLRIPSAAIELTVFPLIADQELNTAGSTGVVYWEGAAASAGTSAKKPVSGKGYVEMTGYAGAMGGAF